MKSVYRGSLTPSELGSFQYMKHFRFRRTCIKDRSGWGWAGSFVPGLGTVEADETGAEAVESMAVMAADEAVESMAAIVADEAVESMAVVAVDETDESVAVVAADTF